MNFYPFNDIETISPRPMLFITGDQAHSKEFSEDAYKRAAEPKELFIVPGAGHVDLCDRVTLIPWDKLTSFWQASRPDRRLMHGRWVGVLLMLPLLWRELPWGLRAGDTGQPPSHHPTRHRAERPPL